VARVAEHVADRPCWQFLGDVGRDAGCQTSVMEWCGVRGLGGPRAVVLRSGTGTAGYWVVSSGGRLES